MSNVPLFTAQNFIPTNTYAQVPLEQESSYLLPDHYLSQGPSVQETAPLRYKQIIVPTGGIDQAFFSKVAERLEISFDDFSRHAELDYLFNMIAQQFGDCYDVNTLQFLHLLNGNQESGGIMPGYPTPEPFSQTALCLPENWNWFKMEFRKFALDQAAWISSYTQMFPTFDLVFHTRIHGGFAFYLGQKNTPIVL